MEKGLKIILSNDKSKHYKIEETGGKFYVKRFEKDIIISSVWETIGNSRSFEDAVTLARADASSFGNIRRVEFN